MNQMSAPYFHIETFGAVDGPGSRLVLFLQGCFLKCAYCHNPESWEFKRDKLITVDEVIEKYERNKEFYEKGGGITVSGGEPTIHAKFIFELFKKCKEKGIHTCIDTCGFTFDKDNEARMKVFDDLKSVTSLWIVDVKHMTEAGHLKVTEKKERKELDLIRWLDKNEAPFWLRQVLLKDYTDNPADLKLLGNFIASLKHMLRFEILPFHNMAQPKWEELRMKYKLKDEPGTTKEQVHVAIEIIKEGIREGRRH